MYIILKIKFRIIRMKIVFLKIHFHFFQNLKSHEQYKKKYVKDKKRERMCEK